MNISSLVQKSPREALGYALETYDVARSQYEEMIVEQSDIRTTALMRIDAERRHSGQHLEQQHEQAISRLQGELNHVTELLTAITNVETSAKRLMKAACIAYISVPPESIDEGGMDTDLRESVAEAFVNAQVCYSDLRTGLIRLARAYVSCKKWADAYQILSAILQEAPDSHSSDVDMLIREVHYHLGLSCFELKDWVAARVHLQAAQGIRDSHTYLRESYLIPAKEAVGQGEWRTAREHIKIWADINLNDREAQDLLVEANSKIALETTGYMAEPIVVTDSSFPQDVLGAHHPILVHFWAPWCGPCRMITPILGQLSEELHFKLKIATVNIDENQHVAGNLGIMSIPTLMLFKHGHQVETIVGFQPKSKMMAIIHPHLE